MKVLFLLLLFVSCSKKEVSFTDKIHSIEFHTQWGQRLITTYPFSDDAFVKGPAGTWTTLMEIRAQASTSKFFDSCLLYQFSEEGKKNGVLKFIFKEKAQCKDYYYQDEGIIIETIEALWYQKNKGNCQHHFSIRRENKERSLCLNFLNSQKRKKFSMGESSAEQRKAAQGLLVLPVEKEIYPTVPIALQGDVADRFQEENTILCEKVNSKCQVEGASTCDRCRWGWVEVIDSNCANNGSKYCAVDSCGQKGEPACFRGRKHSGTQSKDYCQDKLIGFCQENLELVCRDGIVMCW